MADEIILTCLRCGFVGLGWQVGEADVTFQCSKCEPVSWHKDWEVLTNDVLMVGEVRDA